MKVSQRHHDDLRTRQDLDAAIDWRRRSLLTAGFAPDAAAKVAADLRYDLHAMLQLVDRGCAPELAVRIVDPLPDEVR